MNNTHKLLDTTGQLVDDGTRPAPKGPLPSRATILLLAASVALMQTGYGIVLPIFAKRLGELGAGATVLGLMTLCFALAQFLLSPFAGTLGDRIGRRPLILTALVGEVAANVAFIFASTPELYVIIRFFQGAVTAGMLPSSLAVVGDTVPDKQRAQWLGIMTGSYGMGFIFGPVLGGFLFDHWGYTAPFSVSACLGSIALLLAIFLLPETHPPSLYPRVPRVKGQRVLLLAGWPRPLYLFLTLLAVDFVAIFGLAFVEPQLALFAYNQLDMTPTQLGLIVGGYGLTVLLGQAFLGQLSDTFGRKPLIVLGLLLNTTLFPSLVIITQFSVLFTIAMVAGLGNALVTPALTSSYLDMSDEKHRSQVLGIRASVAALGGVVGPLLFTILSVWVAPRGIFAIAGAITLAIAVLAFVVLRKGPAHAEEVSVSGE